MKMNNIYETFGSNKETEKNGVWVEYGEGKDAPAFLLARMSSANKKYQKKLEASTKPYRRKIELGLLDDKTSEKVYMGVFLSTILLDWKNITNSKGKAIEFNKENATQVLTDLPDLYDALMADAKNKDLFRAEDLEADSKN